MTPDTHIEITPCVPETGDILVTESYVLPKHLVEAMRLLAQHRGWIEYRESGDDPLDETGSLPYSTVLRLRDHRLVKKDLMAWHDTFVFTTKGKKVAGLL